MTQRTPPPGKTPQLHARDQQRLDEHMQEPLDPRESERLIHDRELGGLIERANVAYRARLDEHAAFQRLQARHERRTRAAWGWRSVTFAATLSAAAGAMSFLGVFDEEPSHVALGPELSPNRPRTAPTPEGSGIEPTSSKEVRRAGGSAGADALANDRLGDGSEEASTEAGPDEALEAVSPEAAERAAARNLRVAPEREVEKAPAQTVPRAPARDGEQDRGRDGVPNPARVAQPQRTLAPEAEAAPQLAITPRTELRPTPGSSQAVAPVNQAKGVEVPTSMTPPADRRADCLDLAGQGEPRAAELCYAQRAAGSGLSAEAALYEMARLRRDGLHDADGALAALNDYRQRFPNGSLHNEVALSRLELLSELGRGREALRESEALLASAKGQERAAELHMLRGDVFRRELSDWRAAAKEYGKVEAFGGALGAEATRLRGMSLEAAGDAAGALEAYRKYLGLGAVEKRAEVSRRVEAIVSRERGATP